MTTTLFTSALKKVPAAQKIHLRYKLSGVERKAFAQKLRAKSETIYQNDQMTSYVRFLKKESPFPKPLQKAVDRFAQKGNQVGVYLVENLPLDSIQGFQKTGSLAELGLLSFATALGKPFGYANQRGGEIIQNLIPKKEDAEKQLGTGAVALVWHTEDAHTSLNCDYIGLLCLRGDPEAATLVSCINPKELDKKMRAELEKKQYVISADGSYSKASQNKTAVLSYKQKRLIVKYDPIYTKCLTDQAKKALDYLTDYINSKAVGVYLKTGDLLLVDNNRSVHARTLYHPRYDDTDRWLKRVAILQKKVPASALVAKNKFVINI